MLNFISFLFIFLSTSIFSNEALLLSRNERERHLIKHVEKSLDQAYNASSKLTAQALDIQGMSSAKVRHFLNNLCSLPNTHYLEIGVWHGSTWISALLGNEATISSAVAIDNWSQFAENGTEFLSNCHRFLPNFPFKFYSADCFSLNANSTCKSPVSIYFFDGEHSELAHELAFTHYNSVLDDLFIAVIDDWNYPPVQIGTENAFKKLNYTILYEKHLPSTCLGDLDNWWNGLYVAVISKSKITKAE